MAKKSKTKAPVKKRGAKSAAPKKRDYKAEYERRIRNATKRGKTKQEARGHRKGEHIERAEREREELGITRAQENTIRGWYSRNYNPHNYPENARADLDDALEYARENGYDAFKQWRTVWDIVRRTYLQEVADGSYASRGQAYLIDITSKAGVEDVSWLYYH